MVSIETRKDVTNMAESKYRFQRLTPIDNIDLDVYEDAVDYVFDNPDVKNVAPLGGGYYEVLGYGCPAY